MIWFCTFHGDGDLLYMFDIMMLLFHSIPTIFNIQQWLLLSYHIISLGFKFFYLNLTTDTMKEKLKKKRTFQHIHTVAEANYRKDRKIKKKKSHPWRHAEVYWLMFPWLWLTDWSATCVGDTTRGNGGAFPAQPTHRQFKKVQDVRDQRARRKGAWRRGSIGLP